MKQNKYFKKTGSWKNTHGLFFFSFNFNLRLKKRKKILKLESLKANLLIDYIPRNIVSEKKKKTDSMDLNSKTFFLKYRVDNASYQKNFKHCN